MKILAINGSYRGEWGLPQRWIEQMLFDRIYGCSMSKDCR